MLDEQKPKEQLITELCDLRRLLNISEQEQQQLKLSIIERKRAENIMQARLRLLKFAESHSLEEFTQATLDESEGLTCSTIGFYHLVEPNQRTLSLQSWSTNTLQNMCTAEAKGQHYNVAEAGVWVDCVHQRRPVIHNCYDTLPNRKGMPPGHAPLTRELVVPIFRADKIVAIIGVGNKASDYDEWDVEAVSLLGDLSWDITERKRAEEALRHSEASLAEAHRIAHLGNWEWDIARNKLTLSDEIYRILGLTRQEFHPTREDFLSWVHPEDLLTVNHKLAEGIKSGKYGPYVYRIVRSDGSMRYIYARGETYFDQEGQPRRMLGTVQDVTELKQAEEALRESEERLRLLGDNLPESAVYQYVHEPGSSVCFLYVSAGIEQLNGVEVQDVLNDAGTLHRQLLPGYYERLVKAEVRCARELSDFEMEVQMRRPDGQIRWMQLHSRPRPMPDGRTIWDGVQTDITERKRAEEELRHRTAELEATNQELESFSYSVAHDLKTPIRAIQGFSRMLMGEHAGKLDAEALRLLKVICTNTKIMAQLIDDLLGLSRLTRQPMRKTELHLDDMARQIFERLKSQAPDRSLQLTANGLPPAYADHSLLYQVMINLLGNAIKYTKTRKTAIIEVGGRTDGDENIYYIKDNGIGFDQRYIDNLFGPFQRLHSLEEYEGTGIGLAIVQRIIQKHGGRVWGESKVGAGATFYFALPKNGTLGRQFCSDGLLRMCRLPL